MKKREKTAVKLIAFSEIYLMIMMSVAFAVILMETTPTSAADYYNAPSGTYALESGNVYKWENNKWVSTTFTQQDLASTAVFGFQKTGALPPAGVDT